MTYYIDTETFDFRKLDILSFKEKTILYLISLGYKGREIAKVFNISLCNFRQQTYNMRSKVVRLK